MRILIVGMARSGGYELHRWLGLELGYKGIHEPIYNGLSTEGDNIVVKYLVNELENNSECESYLSGWDKIIGLVRENERECAISQTYAVENREWRKGYELNKGWISEREEVIKGFEEWAVKQREWVQNLNVFTISYEGIYNRGEDIERICEYVGIQNPKYLHLLSNTNRLRKTKESKGKPLI